MWWPISMRRLRSVIRDGNIVWASESQRGASCMKLKAPLRSRSSLMRTTVSSTSSPVTWIRPRHSAPTSTATRAWPMRRTSAASVATPGMVRPTPERFSPPSKSYAACSIVTGPPSMRSSGSLARQTRNQERVTIHTPSPARSRSTVTAVTIERSARRSRERRRVEEPIEPGDVVRSRGTAAGDSPRFRGPRSRPTTGGGAGRVDPGIVGSVRGMDRPTIRFP